MARPRHEEGVLGWTRRWWRALLAEVVSTALLVWLGCATLVPVAGPGSVLLTHPALGFGFVVIANICAFGSASGAHMNPAVTLGAVLYGQLPVLPALGYVVAQLLGAALGFGGLVATSPGAAIAGTVGVTLPGPDVSPLAAMVTEVVLTGTLVLAVCGVWAAHDPLSPDHAAPVKLGLVIAGLVYAGGPATGASLNPARSFGPALVQGHWQHHWVYWVGPLLGGALAALLHRWVLSPRPAVAAAAVDAEIPLNDKP
ncbi:lens fiber major intrinsic protein-like isoform X3 [Anticarsia gemmatalis]|uniref:lens fiber major intrinsic protein-like isoform X3 n=1 Tax=Anticarsia gemmatalis TaxID=129554 RepID=UPI003F767202